jgi:PIN domain
VTAPKPAVIDANVLFSATIRDLLIRCHIAGIIRIHWTSRILDETFIAIARERPGLDPVRLQRTRDLMNKGARAADITDLVDDELFLDESVAPDVNDLHVVRAAAAIGADIVTWNLDDFPASLVEPLGIAAMSPDAFFGAVSESALDEISRIIERQASELRNPPVDSETLLRRLDKQRLGKLAGAVRLGRLKSAKF